MTLRSAFLFLLAFRTDCWSARAVSPPAAVPDAAPSPAFAWYIPLTLEPHFLRQAVVLSGSILDTNTAGDVVAALFADPGLEASRSAVPLFDPRVKLRWATLPFGVEDVVSPAYRERVRGRMWSFQKLDAWLLTAYRSVVVLDSDMLFLRNADELFWTPPGSHSDGPMSPFNAGLFVVRPDAADFADLVALARAGNETACGGWLGAWPNASFYQSEFEQGACLFFYFFYFARPAWPKVILDRSVYNAQRLPGVKNETERHAGAVDCSGGPGGRPVVLPQLAPKIVHFTTCGKPSHVGPADGGGGADGGDPCARYHRAWRQRWRLALNASGRAEP